MALGAQNRFLAQCVIAVTGYAQAYAGQVPHAYYHVLCGTDSKAGLIHGTFLSRNRMRAKVAEEALTVLAGMLQP
jgi:nicotinamide mononucleotide (NMN) deamidase PncC